MVVSSTSKRIVGRRTRRFFELSFLGRLLNITHPNKGDKKKMIKPPSIGRCISHKKCETFPASHISFTGGYVVSLGVGAFFSRFLMTFPDPERFTGPSFPKKKGRPLKGPQIESLKLNQPLDFSDLLKLAGFVSVRVISISLASISPYILTQPTIAPSFSISSPT